MNATTVLLFGIIVLAYLYIFVIEAKKEEGFSQPINTGELRKPCKESVIMEQQMAAPYVKQAILDVDDYEYNLVFQNEGDREMTKALQNKLQSQYPMDWSVQPPSSVHFETGKKRLMESFANAPVGGQATNKGK